MRGNKYGEVRTTVRNFVNEMTAHHIPFDARIRVIIDEPQILREPMEYEISSVPPITLADQRQRLNRLPHDYDPSCVGRIDCCHQSLSL